MLVRHAFGVLVIRLYAAAYPDELAGLVVVDAMHEVHGDQLHAVLTPAKWSAATQPPAELAAASIFERLDPDTRAAAMREAAAALLAPESPMVGSNRAP